MQSRYHNDTELTDTNHNTHSTLWVNTHTQKEREDPLFHLEEGDYGSQASSLLDCSLACSLF